MHCGFCEKNGELHADFIPLSTIATDYGTPAYIYSASTIRETVGQLKLALAAALPAHRQPMIAFACKANSNLAVLKQMAVLGLGADIVSGGELARALAAGIPANRVLYSGVGKSESEILQAVDAGIYQINIESESELIRIDNAATRLEKPVDLAFRFNPDVEAFTHAKITTGMEENKFGLLQSDLFRLYRKAVENPFLRPCGVSMHIGSQLTSVEPFSKAFRKMAQLVQDLRGQGLTVSRTDLGGGLGVVYHNEAPFDLDAYARLIAEIIEPLGTRIIVEPGRFLVANAGILLTRVETVKRSGARRYIILDAGMNDLIRPALYDAWHGIRPVKAIPGNAPADIVGPVCETGDSFALQRPAGDFAEGDLVAIQSAGAYGASMGSTYNTRPLPPEIMVDGDRIAIVRKRQTVQDMLDRETMPDWLAP